MKTAARHTIWAGLASFAANLAMLSLSLDHRLLIGLAGLSLLSICIGLAFRWRDSRQLAASWTSLLILIALIWLGIGWAGAAESGSYWQRATTTLASAFEHLELSTAPVPPHDGVLVLMLAIAALVCWLTDALYVAGRLVVPTIGVLAVPYLMVSFVPPVSNPAWLVVVLLTSWVALAAASARQQSRDWVNLLPAQDSSQGRGADAIGSSGYRVWNLGAGALFVLVPSLIIGLIAGQAISPDSSPRIDFGDFQQGPIELSDPMIQLNQNLQRPEEVPVLSYRTNQPDGVHLRHASLVSLSSGGWALSDMRLQRGEPEVVPGLTYAEPSVQTEVQIGEFTSNYLPLPYAPLKWDAPGRWGFDPLTLTVVDTRRGTEASSTGMQYTVQSTFTGPSFDVLQSAKAGTPPDASQTKHLPPEVPAAIIDLTTQLTETASSDGQKALALQDYLRDDSRFSYSLNAPTGVGFSVLNNFLFESRSGYCIHFASSMALMARIAGIPSRLAVGFTPGSLQDDGSYLVTSHNMHAWPELFFEDLGWVRFEPTVAVSQAPQYTSAEQPPPPTPTPTRIEPRPEPTFEPKPNPENTEDVEDPQSTAASGSWLGWVVGFGLLVLVLLSPRLIRSRLRRIRLSAVGPAGVHGAWTEAAASYLDHGRSWPDGSPRSIAAELRSGLDEDGVVALNRLAAARERALFADPDSWSEDLPQLVDDAKTIEDQVRRTASSQRRILGQLWPASLFSAQVRNLDKQRRSS